VPDLPEVTQTFEADVGPYVTAIREAIAETNDLRDAILEAAAAAKALGEALGSAAGSGETLAAIQRDVADASAELLEQTTLLIAVDGRLASIQRDVAESSVTLALMNDMLGESFDKVNGQLDSVIAHLAALRAAQAATATDTGRQAGIMLGWWRLTGNQIHWIVAGTVEFLAVALPAAIAIGLGAFVLYQGVVEDVARRMQALYTATEATANLFHKTTGDVLGLGHAFQTAQNAANPIAYQLLGNYIDVARQHMTNFAGAGLEVADAVRKLGAEIQVDLISHGAEFTGLLSHMVSDAIEFGQILGNLGHAVLNLAADMPGLAEVLLRVADAITQVIGWISRLPRWVILGAIAFEELIRWGGLAFSLMGRLAGVFASVATAVGATGLAESLTAGGEAMAAASTQATHFGAVLRNVFVGAFAIAKTVIQGLLAVIITFFSTLAAGDGILAAVTGAFDVLVANIKAAIIQIDELLGPVGWLFAGLGLLTGGIILVAHYFHSGADAAQQFGNSLEDAVAKSSNVNALATINDELGRLNSTLAATPKTITYAGGAMSRFGQDVEQHANPAVAQLTQYQSKLMSQGANVIDGAEKISRAYGMNFAQSLALADVAGVKLANTQITLGKNANVAGAEIEGLVQGYSRLDQVGGALGTDMNALAIQSGLAGTKVSQLNQALDQFVSNGISVTQNLAAMNQDLTQIGNVGVAVGGRFEAFSGTTAIAINKAAESLRSFSGTGAQTWQNYDAAISQAQQLTDSFRTAAAYGGVSQRQFTGSIADTVAGLIPFTTHSKTAVEELSQIAQEAGGPATDNFKVLKDWVDQNRISSEAFNQAIQTMTGSMTNAGSAAKQFASDLESQMQQALASALISSENLNGAVDAFQKAVLNSGGAISSSSPQYKALYNDLRAAGLTAAQARTELQELQSEIDAMHGKTIDVNVNTNYSTSGGGGGGGTTVSGYTQPSGGEPYRHGLHGLMVGLQGGGMVYGRGGADVLHALLTAGEAVLTAQAVSALGGPMAIHSLNAQPTAALASGNLGAGGGGGTMALNQHVDVMLDGSKIGSSWRTDLLTYSRRNPSSNVNLRVR
jgi:hypothetical protein